MSYGQTTGIGVAYYLGILYLYPLYPVPTTPLCQVIASLDFNSEQQLYLLITLPDINDLPHSGTVVPLF